MHNSLDCCHFITTQGVLFCFILLCFVVSDENHQLRPKQNVLRSLVESYKFCQFLSVSLSHTSRVCFSVVVLSKIKKNKWTTKLAPRLQQQKFSSIFFAYLYRTQFAPNVSQLLLFFSFFFCRNLLLVCLFVLCVCVS